MAIASRAMQPQRGVCGSNANPAKTAATTIVASPKAGRAERADLSAVAADESEIRLAECMTISKRSQKACLKNRFLGCERVPLALPVRAGVGIEPPFTLAEPVAHGLFKQAPREKLWPVLHINQLLLRCAANGSDRDFRPIGRFPRFLSGPPPAISAGIYRKTCCVPRKSTYHERVAVPVGRGSGAAARSAGLPNYRRRSAKPLAGRQKTTQKGAANALAHPFLAAPAGQAGWLGSLAWLGFAAHVWRSPRWPLCSPARTGWPLRPLLGSIPAATTIIGARARTG